MIEPESLTQITQARLIHLRWLSALAMSIAAVASPSITGSANLMSSLLATAAVVICFNVFLMLAIALGSKEFNPSTWIGSGIQLSFDLASWVFYLYLSGGSGNPLISIFLPLVAIGAIALPKLQAWSLALCAIMAYTLLWQHHHPLSITDQDMAARIHLLGMWAVFTASALVVTWFTLQMTRAVRARDARLAQAREQAIRDDWLISIGSLAAGAAHDLSTPLGTLSLLVEDGLSQSGLPAALQDDLALMQRQIASCKQALTHLTQRAGHPRDGTIMTTLLTEWLQASVNAWQALNPAVSVCCAWAGDLQSCTIADDLLLERAFSSLLDNAMKAQASNIRIHISQAHRKYQIKIEDDGIGITPVALENYRQQLPSTSERGLGIGLLLARGTIERRGGTLTLTPLDRGTRACINLPIGRNIPAPNIQKIL